MLRTQLVAGLVTFPGIPSISIIAPGWRDSMIARLGRITAAVKHPMLTATKTWALAHLLANGMLAGVLLFGGFLAWAVRDRISAGRRPVRDMPGAAAPRTFNDAIAVVDGLLLYGLPVGWAHLHLFGVAPLP